MSARGSGHQKALQLQRRIFRLLKAEVRLLLGNPPDTLRRYENEFQRDFRLSGKQAKSLDKSQLIERVRKADVTFIADFHSFHQAQRTALRIMREAIQPEYRWALGLELVSSQFQNELDAYQSGKISTQIFHERISYSKEWGFPWKNYLPLFEWARDHGVSLVALNRPKTLFLSNEKRELHERDQWAAGVITDFFQREQSQERPLKMLVLYGEHHLGSTHLPSHLKKISGSCFPSPLKHLSIHQNQEKLYWKLAEEHPEIHSKIFEVSSDALCVFSSPPWTKLQSLINWVEDETPEVAQDCDYLSQMKNYGSTVAEFFSLTPPSFESLSAFTLEDADFLERLHAKTHFSAEELRWIQFHIRTNQRLYIPYLKVAYLGTPSANGVAELASIHLFRSLNLVSHFFDRSEEDFQRLILEMSFGFLGSLILNPHRLCDLPSDHLRRLEQLEAGASPTFRWELEARQIAIHFLQENSSSKSIGSPKLSSLSSSSSLPNALARKQMIPALLIAARYIGRIFAKHLHQAIFLEKISLNDLRDLLLTPIRPSETFSSRSHQIQDLLEGVPLPASKQDPL